MTNRLKEILKQNAEFEKQAPYNFCDRWCERCDFEKKSNCKVYKVELESKMACMAHGQEPDNMNLLLEIMEEKAEEIGETVESIEEELDLEDMGHFDPEKIKNHLQSAQNNPLFKIANDYSAKAAAFLKIAFHEKKATTPELAYNFQTVSWYHILISAKLKRALAGFHKPTIEGDIALYDAVAQLEICKKAISLSLTALSEIGKPIQDLGPDISYLIVLLKEIRKKIEELEKTI